MIYVMSDLHGCYEKYIKMIEKINLSDEDTLYILGDVIDRGDDGIKILLDMMMRDNVVPIIGNHELMAIKVLKKLNVEITEDNYDNHFDIEAMQDYEHWVYNGGNTTLKAFSLLSSLQRDSVIDYIMDFEVYEELEVNGRKFVLVHSGFKEFDADKDLGEYDVYELVWGRCDYSRQYYPDKYLVTGHTPTLLISSEYDGRIYNKNNHIAIDCGAVFSKPLGCICLDTLEEFYVE